MQSLKKIHWVGTYVKVPLRPEVNVKDKVTQDGMHHLAISRGVNIPNLGFIHQII